MTIHSLSREIQSSSIAANDSLLMHKDVLQSIYILAIAQFIKATYRKDKVIFDTLYYETI